MDTVNRDSPKQVAALLRGDWQMLGTLSSMEQHISTTQAQSGVVKLRGTTNGYKVCWLLSAKSTLTVMDESTGVNLAVS